MVEPGPMINKLPPINRDYSRDPGGFTNQGSTFVLVPGRGLACPVDPRTCQTEPLNL